MPANTDQRSGAKLGIRFTMHPVDEPPLTGTGYGSQAPGRHCCVFSPIVMSTFLQARPIGAVCPWSNWPKKCVAPNGRPLCLGF